MLETEDVECTCVTILSTLPIIAEEDDVQNDLASNGSWGFSCALLRHDSLAGCAERNTSENNTILQGRDVLHMIPKHSLTSMKYERYVERNDFQSWLVKMSVA